MCVLVFTKKGVNGTNSIIFITLLPLTVECYWIGSLLNQNRIWFQYDKHIQPLCMLFNQQVYIGYT